MRIETYEPTPAGRRTDRGGIEDVLTTLDMYRSMPAPTSYEAGKRTAYAEVATMIRRLLLDDTA